MSDNDSFINEVTEEVRRDRLFSLMRRYGWLVVLAILLIVGGAAWNEWRKATAREEAQAFGDAILAALSAREASDRATALDAVAAPGPGGAAVVDLLASAERSEADTSEAARRLLELADTPDTPAIYRHLAILKAVALPGSGLSSEARRERLAPLAAQPGLLRLLAEEQLAMIDIETGARGAALDRLSALAADAEATPPLRRRVGQVIVALGQEPPERPGATGETGVGQ